MQVSLAHIQSVIKIGRTSTAYKTPEKEICYYLSSDPADSRTPEQWLQLSRGHWGGVEIRNHWRKDAILLEDKTRSRNPTMVGALAMMRNVLLFKYRDQDEHPTLPGFVEDIAANKNKAFSMVMRS